MSDIREKIMAIERPRYCRVSAYKAGFEDALVAAADIAEAEVQRLEAQLAESEKVNFHLASWQCPFTDGKTGLVNAENGDQYCEMERKIQRLEAIINKLKFVCPEGVSVVDFIDMPDEWVRKQVYDNVVDEKIRLEARVRELEGRLQFAYHYTDRWGE